MTWTMKVYSSLPISLQNAACSAMGAWISATRFGKNFRQKLEEYNQRKTWDCGQIYEFRDARLRKLIMHAYDKTRYYRRKFDEAGVDPASIRTLDDLKCLPILTKEDVRQHTNELIADGYGKKNLVRMHTSGTTGSGLVFYTTKEAECEKWAEAWSGNEAVGLRRSMRRAYFGGRNIVPAYQSSPPYYRFDRYGNQILLSAFHMSKAGFESFYEGFCKYRPTWIHGFPSSIVPFALFLLDRGLLLPQKIKYVTLSSENVTERHKEIIRMAFGVEAYQNYAQTEAVATCREDCRHRMYVSEDITGVEFTPCGNGFSKIVGTSLVNFGMPLIRYDTGDIATWMEDERGRRVHTLDGRLEDSLRLPDGSILRRLDFLFKDQVSIESAQIVQMAEDLIEVRIVPGAGFTDDDEYCLAKAFEERLAGKMRFKIVRVSSIPRTKAGKMKFIVSEFDHE